MSNEESRALHKLMRRKLDEVNLEMQSRWVGLAGEKQQPWKVGCGPGDYPISQSVRALARSNARAIRGSVDWMGFIKAKVR
jgi:hypothetical protein